MRAAEQRLMREALRLQGILESQLVRGFFRANLRANGTAPGQPGSPTQGRLSRTAALLAAVSCGSAVGVGQRSGRIRSWSAQCGDALRVLAVLPVGSALPAALHMRAAAAFAGCQTGTRRRPTRLKRGVELKTPVAGSWSQTAGRHLKAEFHFNRKYTPGTDRNKTGSSTWGTA